jgi:hypothetical protein
MTQNNWFVLDSGRVTVLTGQHVDLALVDSQLANVRLEEKDIRALHERIQDLGGRQTPFEPSHDLTTLFDARHVEATSDIEHGRPVGRRLLGNFFRRPFKDDIRQVHARRLPNFNKIVADRFDFVQITAHFIIHESKPVGDPKDKGRVGTLRGTLVDIHGLEDALGNVHAPRRFKAVVQVETSVYGASSLALQQRL